MEICSSGLSAITLIRSVKTFCTVILNTNGPYISVHIGRHFFLQISFFGVRDKSSSTIVINHCASILLSSKKPRKYVVLVPLPYIGYVRVWFRIPTVRLISIMLSIISAQLGCF